jgi:peptide/nickel transport system ATP-binding protein
VKLLELEHVSKRFVQPLDLAGRIARALGADLSDEVVHAVDDVSFSVKEGEVVGLVGESGCGKSTLGRMVAGILPPSAGQIRYRGQERIGLKVQMIFQDPFASLNPRMRVDDIVGEAPLVHGIVKKEELDGYLDALLVRCGLDPSYKRRYPHQFSGGQRSRIGIARALAVKPEFLVCDEAVAALDVSIQAQILNLFMKLRSELGLTYLFISHDLGVVEHLSDRVVIMYLGRVVESASADEIFRAPNHPYTQALLKQVPRLDTRKTQFKPIVGEIPSPLSPPGGCHFHPRCPHAMARCREQAPALKEVGSGHLSACHLNEG